MAFHHVQAFADWVDTKATQGKTFQDWRNSFWPKYQKHCMDIARNIYIMHASTEAFQMLLQPDTTWEQAMANTDLRNDIDDICESVQISTDDYFTYGAREHFEKRCREIFDSVREKNSYSLKNKPI